MNKEIHIVLNDHPYEFCKCGCPFFRTRTMLKRVNGIMAGLPKDQIIPIDILMCEKCGNIHEISKNSYPGLIIPVPIVPLDIVKE